MRKTPPCASVFRRDPELGFLEWRSSLIQGAPFGVHTHDTVSVAVVRGGSYALSCRGETRAAGPGSAVFFPAEEPHSCNPLPGEAMDYRKYYLAPVWFEALRLELAGEPAAPPAWSILKDGAARPAVVSDQGSAVAFAALARALEGEAAAGEKLALLREALARLLRAPAYFMGEGEPTAEREAVSAVVRAISRDPAETIRLEELAEASGLTPSHLLRVFRRSRGLTPHAFQNQLRVNLAKRLLAGGEPIAQVALEAGFVDQSHLNRVFRRYMGATPRQYLLGARP
ncbi:AraC family transcriptional regulator [Fundidesulfovibrio soli]|uniref:AraC family transcriptional regulator n=1 Tax=Fundidesulfovibrio soli TaxID=2922716 RepID=UPI001FAFD011|nr:AraC family transcriptional regulator [Fundidesulfovibrio soli]